MERNTFPNIPNEINLKESATFLDYRKILKEKTIAVDMGCGHGDFLIEHTVKQPDKFFIGVEISRKRVAKTSERLKKRGITNYAVIDSEGEIALKLFFPDESVDELHVNFPDPWLRKRQWKNRIFKPSFLIQAVRVLKPEGILYFVTDVEEYALHVAELLKLFPGLTNVYSNLIEKNKFETFPTLFYRKMSPLRDINYLCFKKTNP